MNLKSELIGPMVLNMVARSCDNPDVFLANHYLLVRSQFSPEITHLHYLGYNYEAAMRKYQQVRDNVTSALENLAAEGR